MFKIEEYLSPPTVTDGIIKKREVKEIFSSPKKGIIVPYVHISEIHPVSNIFYTDDVVFFSIWFILKNDLSSGLCLVTFLDENNNRLKSLERADFSAIRMSDSGDQYNTTNISYVEPGDNRLLTNGTPFIKNKSYVISGGFFRERT